MKEQLPARVLAELFSNSLVYTGEKIRNEIEYEDTEPADIKQQPAAIKKKPGVGKQAPVTTQPEPVEAKPMHVEEKIEIPGKWYLGNYEKKFIVLVNDENNLYLSDKDLELLTGILNACKMNLAHIALINFRNHAVSFQHLKKEMQPRYILSFGLNALQIELPFTMPDYQVQQYDNCSILTAPTLRQLNQITPGAKAEKTKLWNCLKKMLDL